MYDVDFDHQFIETEKYDAKPTYKKFLGYRPGVSVIGDLIVGIENSNGNTVFSAFLNAFYPEKRDNRKRCGGSVESEWDYFKLRYYINRKKLI